MFKLENLLCYSTMVTIKEIKNVQKPPPCHQYEPPKHVKATSKLGKQFCRIARQSKQP